MHAYAWGWGSYKNRSPRYPALELGITPLSLFLQLKATDADEGEFGRVWYRILHGEWAASGQEGWPLP